MNARYGVRKPAVPEWYARTAARTNITAFAAEYAGTRVSNEPRAGNRNQGRRRLQRVVRTNAERNQRCARVVE